MKKHLLPILLATFSQLSYAQSFDSKLFQYKGLSFTSKKSDIFDDLGVPNSITEPNYECGFLSEAEQGKKYYSLNYGNTVFTGNDEEGYLLENIVFEGGETIQYGGFMLTGRTTVADLIVILGSEWSTGLEDPTNGSVVISFGETADDGIRIFILNGLLQKMHYWSPC